MEIDVVQNLRSGLETIKENQEFLKTSLISKGITVGNNDHIPQLVEKVINIRNNPYFAKGITFPVSSSQTFRIENLNRKPIEFGYLSEDLINGKVYSVSDGYVVPTLSVVFTADTITVGDCDISRIYNAENQMWSIVLSYERTNADKIIKTFFQGGFEYEWAVIFDEQI